MMLFEFNNIHNAKLEYIYHQYFKRNLRVSSNAIYNINILDGWIDGLIDSFNVNTL